ncbi:retrovirus-related pol polyprotein from transposon TNT 1-94 [Tanacetum coccineum]|uniref:Retrovirus-related pol polyprotein from transposon TNT 1-94 n=1 Tax=Tanacetum coccineum TaxID=301880 RepID=A0ABQ5D7T5_9ASTR
MTLSIVLMAKDSKAKNYSTPTHNTREFQSTCHRQIAQPGMSMGQTDSRDCSKQWLFQKCVQDSVCSDCKHVKLDIRNDKSEVICAMCKQCLITANHDVCMLNYVNDMNSRGKKQKANVSNTENQKKQKPKNVGSNERLASPKPSKPRFCLRWSPTGRLFDIKGKIIASSESESQSDCSNGDNACTSNPSEPKIKRFPNSTFFLGRLSKFFLGTVRFGNDHVAAILGFGDLQWGNILITRVYFVEGLGHNLFSVGQFCDSDLEVAFRRNSCFVRSLEGVDLLKGNRSTNLYTINLHEMASASPICLMARATSTKSWLWHQRLSHLNFDTINDLAKNDLVTGLPKFKYHKEHLCPSCEQGKSKRASHPPKPVPNSKQRLHLLHMDLCGPMRIASINGKRYVLVIVDDYSRYTWTLVEVARTMLIFSCALLFLWAEAIATACYTQNCSIIHRRFNKTPYKLTNGRKPAISFLHVSGALCYPKNDHEDIGKLGAKGDIVFFIGYSADSCAYRVYNRRTKKNIKTMNVTFDELSAMAFKQSSSKPGLQSMTSGQISYGLDFTYAPSTITTQKPTECELDLLFEAMHDDYIGGQPSAAPRSATNLPNTSQDVDELETQHVQHQPAKIANNVPNDMFNENTFVNPFATPSTSDAESSSSQYVDPSNMHTFYQPYPYEYQWTKDHPLEQVIGEPSRPVLIRNQLRSDGDMCMYALTWSAGIVEDYGFELIRIFNAIWGCKDTSKSTFGGAQFLGEKLVSWSSKKQDCTSLSTAESEYVSLSACCAQVIWMRTQLTDYGYHFNKILIYCDSKSAIAISCNPVQHSRTKHIVVRYHFIKEHVEKGTIELYFVKTDYQLADLFTKALPVDQFNYLVRRLGMRSLSP